MKHTITLCLLALLTAVPSLAQKHTTMTATVERVTHKAAVKHDQTATGKFYFRAPDRLCLTFAGGKDALVMNGKTYTLVRRGKRSVAKGAMQQSMDPLQAVLKAVCTGGQPSSAGSPDVALAKDGTNTVVTITPLSGNAKARKRLLFTSFVVTVDSKTSELKAMRMVGRGKGNYTDYLFSSPSYGATIDDAVFK